MVSLQAPSKLLKLPMKQAAGSSNVISIIIHLLYQIFNNYYWPTGGDVNSSFLRPFFRRAVAIPLAISFRLYYLRLQSGSASNFMAPPSRLSNGTGRLFQTGRHDDGR